MKTRTLDTLAGSLLVMVLVSAGGCAGQYESLKPYSEIPRLAELVKARDAIPRKMEMVPSGEVDGQSLRLAMEKVGNRGADRLVVMLHGVLSNRGVWQYMAGDLGRDHDLLLIDLPGCGDSDRPDPERMGPKGYSPSGMARHILAGLRNYMQGHGYPAKIVVVGHSLGGAVTLRMLGDPQLRSEYSDVLDRVEKAVLMAPLDFAVEKEQQDFARIANLGRTKVALAAGLGLLRNAVAKSSRRGYSDPDAAPREGARTQIEILRHKTTRRAAQAMILQAVPFDLKKRRPDWPAIERLVADYGNVQVPTMILWGARDETLPTSMGYKLQEQLPHAWLRVLEATKHSLPTERPRISSDLVRDFLGGSSIGRQEVGWIPVESRIAAAGGK